MADLGIWQFSDVSHSGTNPFQSAVSGNPSAVGSTITLDPAASMKVATVTDNDTNFNNTDVSQQTLAANITLDGTQYEAGDEVSPEYSYIIRPAGSSDPADNITFYVVVSDGDQVGFITDAPLTPGQTYDIIATDTNSPSVPYTNLFVCFARGTGIRTARGALPVEQITPGTLIQTADNGLRPVCWVAKRRAPGTGTGAPVVVQPGVLGNARRLVVSQQHRLLVTAVNRHGQRLERLVAAKALVGQPGVALDPCAQVEYIHLLFDRHELLFAEGAPAESLLPGPMALAALGARARRHLTAALPELVRHPATEDNAARTILRPGQWRRAACRLA